MDVLCENDIYRDQDFANEAVVDAWTELDRRAESLFEGTPFLVKGRLVRRQSSWDDDSTYSFCMLLTIQVLFRKWARQFGLGYTLQGDLFEGLTAECLEQLGWIVLRTGWAQGNAARIKSVMEGVCAHIGEPGSPGEFDKWVPKSANEAGLDVVCSDPFYDG